MGAQTQEAKAFNREGRKVYAKDAEKI